MRATRTPASRATRRTVGEVARLVGTTVRTLHHWHEIGLVVPSDRSDAGYRLYDGADLERLHQVLVYRELGFALEQIRDLLDDPSFDRGAALREQRAALLAEHARLGRLVAAVETAIAAHEERRPMSDPEIVEALGGFDPAAHEAEARERWGDTDAYAQSTARVSQYTAQDLRAIRTEADAIVRRLAQAMAAGQPADGVAAMDVAEAHRRHIDVRYYHCPPRMHAGLGAMYVDDPRFTAYWEDVAPGLAAYARDAFAANAARAERDGAD